MEKRTILAFALSFLVLFIWMQFMPQKPVPVQKDGPAVETEVLEGIAESEKVSDLLSSAESQTLKEAASRVESKVDEKEILVDTPLYTAIFSHVGTTIKSFKLQN